MVDYGGGAWTAQKPKTLEGPDGTEDTKNKTFKTFSFSHFLLSLFQKRMCKWEVFSVVDCQSKWFCHDFLFSQID